MPRFLCYCPDYPDALDRRLEVRPDHLVRAKQDWATGLQTEGSPFLPVPGSEAAARVLPEGTPNLAGSFMIYNMASLDEAWERVKSDVYWTNKVWDQEKLAIWPLLS